MRGLLPIVLLSGFLGLSAQLRQGNESLDPGAETSRASALASVKAQALVLYADRCLTAALQAPEFVGELQVVLNSGNASVQRPEGARCMTVSAGGGTRNVIAYGTSTPGEAGKLWSLSSGSALWNSVATDGSATNIATGTLVNLPVSVPAGSLVYWAQLTR